MKHGRHGKPKVHYFRLSHNDTMLSWKSAKNKQRGVLLKTVKQVGHVLLQEASLQASQSMRRGVLLKVYKHMCPLALQLIDRTAASKCQCVSAGAGTGSLTQRCSQSCQPVNSGVRPA